MGTGGGNRSPSAATTDAPVVVVGAGPAGLAAARALRVAGLEVILLDRAADVGGLWDASRPDSPMYESAHLISSKPMTEFAELPMPASFPDYPSHRQALSYLRSYADHFGLRALLRGGATVESVTAPATDDVRWQVILAGGERLAAAAVVVASGHHWQPRWPQLTGNFDGELLHSGEYRTLEQVRQRRVLIIGAGNSGADIAVEAARSARCTYLSVRRGYHVVPKFVAGRPADQIGELTRWLPLPLRRVLNGGLLRVIQGDPARWGMPRPDHRLLEAHPLVNSGLLYHLGHGDIALKPAVAELRGPRVAFVDGSEVAVDLILCATGYEPRIPFLAPELWAQGGDAGAEATPRAFLNIFPPGHPTLALVGWIQPDSGEWWLLELQARLVAAYLRAQRQRPLLARRLTAAIERPRWPALHGGVRHLDSPRHALEVEHARYARLLRRYLRRLGARSAAATQILVDKENTVN